MKSNPESPWGRFAWLDVELYPANRTLRRFGLLVLASMIALFFVRAKINAPKKGAVNGIYHNECCDDVVMRDGRLRYKSAFYNYDLENMKFGLTAYVQGDFTEKGIEPSQEQSAFLFFDKNGKRGFDVAIHGRDYSFVKIK